ncbi:hypothetical protein FNV43_RR01543 [Rhamnella rubrinervis]|uniref:Uncharacterized protein n=1 Tax=Rhamnella rubrinervis TaxID=2594499 RepID=A0A8K0MSY8_9ROSA|nr:hypothetical protein FNV43_RR01543 [Rhamnella rubrinervis]
MAKQISAYHTTSEKMQLQSFSYRATSENILALETISDENINLMICSTGDKKLDVKSLLSLVHNILSTTNGAAAGVQHRERQGNMKTEPYDPSFKSPLCTLKRISCELMACKAQGEAINNVEKKTEAILKVLSSYSMDAKLGLSLAVLALEFGELWRLRKDLETPCENNNSQEKEFFLAMAILKGVVKMGNEKAINELKDLISLIMNVTETIFELEKLRSNYSVSQLLKVVGKHAYHTITTIVACATQITILKNNVDQLQDLAPWTSHLTFIYQDLQKHKRICQQQKELDIYKRLINLFEYTRYESHDVVVEILKTIIYAELDAQKLLIGGFSTGEMKVVDMDVLRRKDVLLIISSLDISDDEILSIKRIKEGVYCSHFNIVWVPIVEKWTSEHEIAFHEKRKQMPWYIVQFVSSIAGIRFIKDEWKFNGKPMVVYMTAYGKVETLNALNLIRWKGLEAFPFTKRIEESIQVEMNWVSLIAEKHGPSTIKTWVQQGIFIFFYGGTDLLWIQKFKAKVAEIAGKLEASSGAKGSIKCVLVGKEVEHQGANDPNEIVNEALFWTHIESLNSIQLQKEVEDETQQSLQNLLSFKTESRWAVLSKGSEVLIADHGTNIMRVLKKLSHEIDHIDKFEIAFNKNYKEMTVNFGLIKRERWVKVEETIINNHVHINNGSVVQSYTTNHSQGWSDDNNHLKPGDQLQLAVLNDQEMSVEYESGSQQIIKA